MIAEGCEAFCFKDLKEETLAVNRTSESPAGYPLTEWLMPPHQGCWLMDLRDGM
jgi:hypothetical protein